MGKPENVIDRIVEGKLQKFIDLMENFGIKDLTRTGKIALPRED